MTDRVERGACWLLARAGAFTLGVLLTYPLAHRLARRRT